MIYIIIKCNKWKDKNKNFYEACVEWKEWTLSKSDIIFEMQIEEKLISMTNAIANADRNKNSFTSYEMPFVRFLCVFAFLE